jgi:hypothetical protein
VAQDRPGKNIGARKSQSERIKAYRAKNKAAGVEASGPAQTATKKPGPQSAAAKNAISERMKAYWAKRKSGKGTGSK